jgi:hypothetical protein
VFLPLTEDSHKSQSFKPENAISNWYIIKRCIYHIKTNML